MNVIGLACDHAGYELKGIISKHLSDKGYILVDFGCNTQASCDYPDYAHLLGYAIDNKEITCGLVFCGSGNGINMTVNKHPSVRSALCWNIQIAELARHHNDANVCSLPSRFISVEDALKYSRCFPERIF